MRICLVTRYYLPLIGGIQAHVHYLGRALERAGHSVQILTSCTRTTGPRPPFPPTVEVTTPAVRWIRGAGYVTGARRELCALVREGKVDVVHGHDLYTDRFVTDVARRGAATVFTNHSSHFLEWYARPWRRPLLRQLLRHANAIISPSPELATKTTTVIQGEVPSSYIPNGVDADRFKPATDYQRLLLGRLGISRRSGHFYVVCARRLQPKNGITYLVRSLPRLLSLHPNVLLYVLGDGLASERITCERLARELGVQSSVRFVGAVDHDTMPEVLPGFDLAVLPSLAEATSLACLEAMACGLPVVATRVGGLAALVEDGRTGVLVPPRDPEALASAISLAVSRPEQSREWGVAARRQVIEHFSWAAIADRTVDVYRNAIEISTAARKDSR